ncbi:MULTISPECIES: AfsA-related hotdog domain-containing protein [unclassified Streptomyces]|uniref:AfsA-related hotdog domain-containing protein n=1 Tax=unclassified Streptomyces TaxID=2593676 RepID=UPI001F0408EC|nr:MULTISPECIES: AfsA-related hotdog domain-containing protein [unclassified Streptomyces]MCH0564175.1 hypothetical protein [Streptomyces sp. MUM 2J]MCH0568478.1 hypothetical protein [Streptomyces sp. MUM 136J]
MHETAVDRATGTVSPHRAAVASVRHPEDTGLADAPLTWRSIGLETMASMLVVSLRRLAARYFEAECQWPRLHPLNERVTAVPHHPLIMVESLRQLAVAVERRHLPPVRGARLEAVSVSLGLHPRTRPTERGGATDVTVRCALSDLVVRSGAVEAYRLSAEYLHAGMLFGRGTMRFAPPAPVEGAVADVVPPPALLHPPAAAVGAAGDQDVLLARGAQGRLAVVPRDPAHPVLLPGRPIQLPAPAVLEAGRQAALLSSGMTAAAVIGLRLDLREAVPSCGALVEVAGEPSGVRFLVTAAGRISATGTVQLLGR